MFKFERNQPVKVLTIAGLVDATIAETGSNGCAMAFYPDSTVNKYGMGKMGRTAWGYRVRMPIINPETLEPRTDSNGRPLMGISYVEADRVEPI